MTPRETESYRIYRRAMRKCDWMEYGGLALMAIGMVCFAATLAAMCR